MVDLHLCKADINVRTSDVFWERSLRTMILTLGDMVPPGGVQRVVGAPAGDVCAVRLASAVLELVRWREPCLVVQMRERVDVGPPSTIRTRREERHRQQSRLKI